MFKTYDVYRTVGCSDDANTEQIGQVEASNSPDALRIARERFRFTAGDEIWVDLADLRLATAELLTSEIDVTRLAG